MTSEAKSATALVTLALLSQFATYPLKSYRNGAVEHEGKACLLYLYEAICAAIDAGIMTHGEGIQLFEKARKRIADERRNRLRDDKAPQQPTYIVDRKLTLTRTRIHGATPNAPQ
jgi:hypothetical protein